MYVAAFLWTARYYLSSKNKPLLAAEKVKGGGGELCSLLCVVEW
jgi:hypothetical protein